MVDGEIVKNVHRKTVLIDKMLDLGIDSINLASLTMDMSVEQVALLNTVMQQCFQKGGAFALANAAELMDSSDFGAFRSGAQACKRKIEQYQSEFHAARERRIAEKV